MVEEAGKLIELEHVGVGCMCRLSNEMMVMKTCGIIHYGRSLTEWQVFNTVVNLDGLTYTIPCREMVTILNMTLKELIDDGKSRGNDKK